MKFVPLMSKLMRGHGSEEDNDIRKIKDEYTLEHRLGKGSSGSVCCCRNKANGMFFACKVMNKKGKTRVNEDEVEIMRIVSGHPGVVTLYDVYQNSKRLYVVMEFCSRGDLAHEVGKKGRCSEHEAARILEQVVSVLKFCHEKGIMHRDIKLENILLDASGHVKVADFGIATKISAGQPLSDVVGTPAYVAPEVVGQRYSEKADIWSAGVLLHVLLTGVFPYKVKSMEQVLEATTRTNLTFQGEVWKSISASACDLLKRMLSRNLSTRLTAEEVLKHSWISSHTQQSF